jgi:hypothetical protein
MNNTQTWLTAHEAAQLYNWHPFSMRRLAQRGKVTASKTYRNTHNRTWVIEPGSLYEYMQHHYHKSHRP